MPHTAITEKKEPFFLFIVLTRKIPHKASSPFELLTKTDLGWPLFVRNDRSIHKMWFFRSTFVCQSLMESVRPFAKRSLSLIFFLLMKLRTFSWSCESYFQIFYLPICCMKLFNVTNSMSFDWPNWSMNNLNSVFYTKE